MKKYFLFLGFLIFALLVNSTFSEEEPALPEGLSPSSATQPSANEPVLPEGLEEKSIEEEPTLPEGLFEEQPAEEEKEAEKLIEEEKKLQLPFDLTGFWEIRGGIRTQHDKYEKDASIGETRLQLEIEKSDEIFTYKLIADLLYDQVSGHHRIDLEKGEGFLDLREANVSFTLFDFVDVKIGRQILTWGTGDLLFINDLFPKDWKSFFIGRDEEYLKAPSDAFKFSFFTELVNVDFIYTPRFDADRFIEGKKISFWNGVLGRRSGRDAIVQTDRPDSWFEDDEFAWRIYKNIHSVELAGYVYKGYWKSPAGMNPSNLNAIFPRLNVYGASVRGNVWKGIGNIEVGYYDSHEDSKGTNPFIRNSEFRLLIGYEQEIVRDFTIGVQYYLEHMMHYGGYCDNLLPGAKRKDENRHVLTVRLTRLLLNQNLKLSLFAYYSPSDGDAYLRPNIHYKIDDHWEAEIGGNVFIGSNDYTFFGQFERNNNIYIALRYNF